MIYILENLFWILINLDVICFCSLGLGLLLYAAGTNTRRFGQRLVIYAGVPLAFIALTPFSRIILYNLEHRFSEKTELPEDVKGLILLGGYFSLAESEIGKRPIYNRAGGRLIEFIALAKRYNHLPIVFTGTPKEAALTEQLFKEMGIDSERLKFDNTAKNTSDNVANTYRIIKPKVGEKWALVTSAFHMPRAVGLFRRVGLDNIIPYPVDYHTADLSLWKTILVGIFDRQNLLVWATIMKEGAGLTNAYLTGISSQLYPE
ncbi:MAG: YdcF family protein [Alphaproteobacteria bacterium]|nr:YdcF family protein [Alphaproteobacteria bacterium]